VLVPLQASAAQLADKVLRHSIPVRLLALAQQRDDAPAAGEEEWASPMVTQLVLRLLGGGESEPSHRLAPEGLTKESFSSALRDMTETVQQLRLHATSLGESLPLLLSEALPEATSSRYICRTLSATFHAACGLKGRELLSSDDDGSGAELLVSELNIAGARATDLPGLIGTFGQLLDLVEAIHRAVASRHAPLQSMWREACKVAADADAQQSSAPMSPDDDPPDEAAPKAAIARPEVPAALRRLGLAFHQFEESLSLIADICKQGGLSAETLSFLQRHWSRANLEDIPDMLEIISQCSPSFAERVAPATLPILSKQLLETIQV